MEEMRKGIRMAVLLLFLLPLAAGAQNSAKVKALKARQGEVKKQMNRARGELDRTRQDVDAKLKAISFIGVQLESRLEYIHATEKKIADLDNRIAGLEKKISEQEADLDRVKARYRKSVLYARTNQATHSPLIFVFSARKVSQMYRRARYAKEYAQYQQALGHRIKRKQAVLLEDKGRLLKSKSEMAALVRDIIRQRKELMEQQRHQETVVADLKKHEKVLREQIKKQQKEIDALDNKIDQVIAEEIERARIKAAQEAERRRKAELAARKKKGGSKKEPARKKAAKSAVSQGAWHTPVDHVLSSNFARNKGKLPVPVTGSYMIGGHYGTYQVAGLRNVRLENKGINYIAQRGARARAIFDGEVTAVFQYGGSYNVLIRHGSYISVYCNLSSVIVRKGQQVRTRDLLGGVVEDADGKCVLHFQLRKERTKLNPEVWIGR